MHRGSSLADKFSNLSILGYLVWQFQRYFFLFVCKTEKYAHLFAYF